MPKVFRMRKRSAKEVLIRADKVDARAELPNNPDDPNWLKTRAEAMRRWGLKREKSRIRKTENVRKSRRKKSTLY